MRNNARDNRPRGIRPITKLEVSEERVRLRWILVILLVAIGAAALVFSLYSLLNTEPGWQTVKVHANGLHCGDDFVFQYYFGAEDTSATRENKRLTARYSELCVKAYGLFNRYESVEGMHNVHDINTNVNQVIEVDEVLYNAFALHREYGSRYLYYGAVFAEYGKLFFGHESTPIAEDYDPYQNAEVAAYLAQMAAFAADPDMIDLELLGDNRVRLRVADAYLSFADDHGIDVYVDFFRMKNAFVLDFLADALIADGFTHGCISSYDGYVRNLDASETAYSLNLFDWDQPHVYHAATMNYRGPMAIVSLRRYPLGERDSYDFYTASSGQILPPYIGEDGLYRTATDTLVSYSPSLGCAEIVLRIMPLYVQEDLTVSDVLALSDHAIYSVWFEDRVLSYNQPDMDLTNLYESDEVSYTTKYLGE